MANGAAMRRTDLRSVLGFLTLALIGAACGGSLMPAPDAGTDVPPNVCAHAGCAAPPLCSVGCTAPCGCCNCSPGERNGELVCTDRGCFAPAPDAGADGAGGVCGLPFDPGPCEAAISVFAFVNGSCVLRTYGGCQGNGNRFNTLEDCLATCLAPGACPPNRVARDICLACGPAGGCARRAVTCALVCDPDGGAGPCEPLLPVCYEGVCQTAFCI
jgi:Kunitz/Bovine pancreatic trypsin inhibitor domain